jgi:hypothetical protein
MTPVVESHALHSRLLNVIALMQNYSTSPVPRTNSSRQMLLALRLIRAGLSCAKVSRRSLK